MDRQTDIWMNRTVMYIHRARVRARVSAVDLELELGLGLGRDGLKDKWTGRRTDRQKYK